MRYHARRVGVLTPRRDPGGKQCQAGSLTGAVASQKVTEAPKGPLSTVGNRAQSVNALRELDCETDTSNRDESRG